jgi:NAD(P)-dependent dehydrogenase (short-subunit alcohol dehydrogenase family)
MSYLEKLFSLKGKTALITGAAGGIGSAIAESFHSAGACVLLCDINIDSLQNKEKKLGDNAHFYMLNMEELASFDGVIADAAKVSGIIDILINCAGINKREGFVDVDEATYDRIMNINLKGAFFLSQAVAP